MIKAFLYVVAAVLAVVAAFYFYEIAKRFGYRESSTRLILILFGLSFLVYSISLF